MKTNVVKNAVLSTALSAVLVASVCGGTYRGSNVPEQENSYEVATYQAGQRLSAKQEYDSRSIESFISQVVGGESEQIDYSYNKLYSEYNEVYGYVVDFSFGNGNGYVIVSVVDGAETIVEMELGNSSPYNGKNGKYIYNSFDNYLIENDDGVKSVVGAYGEGLEAGQIGALEPLNNKDKTHIPASQSYSYYTGSVYQYEIKNFCCDYSTDQSIKSNTCANAAGVILLNYWNVYHNNSLLKLDDSEMIRPKEKKYNMKSEVAEKYMSIFYDYMKTNKFLGYGGTLPNDCYAGFERLIAEYDYVTRRGPVTSFEDIKYHINRGVPVIITSQDYYFAGELAELPMLSTTNGDNTFTIDFERWYGILNSHTFIGFGYAEYTLYDKNGEESTIRLVKVADGWGHWRYFNYDISDTTQWGMAAISVASC